MNRIWEAIEKEIHPNDDEPVSTREWMWIQMLVWIPFVNVIAGIYFVTSKKSKPSLKYFFKALWWWVLIIAIFYIAVGVATDAPLW